MSLEATILCIEDEEDLRTDLVEELRSAGYQVLEAANGSEAVNVLRRQRPDLVLCDITMPGLGGYDVLRTMRQQGTLADVPFIFLTALANRNEVLVGKQAGADDYLVKPIDYDLLLATVATRLKQVERVRMGALQQAEQTWREMVRASRGRAMDAMRHATLAFDRMLIGVVIVDRFGRVRLTNNEAQRIIADNDGLYVEDGVLRGLGGKATSRMHACVEQTGDRDSADEVISFARLSGKRPYLVLVPSQGAGEKGDPDAVVLLVIDAEQRTKISGETLARLYNLTRAETRVALMLIDGKRLDQIAEELDVAHTTVVFHLKNLFKKTKTNRQADLVRILLSVPLRSSAEDEE